MEKLQLSSNSGVCDSAIINSLNGTVDGDIGEPESVQLSEQEIHNELVKWAGKLELESIDLREKSNGLTCVLTKNNQLLTSTIKRLKSDLSSIKKDNNDSLKSMNDIIVKSCAILKKDTSSKPNFDQSQILKKLETLKEGNNEKAHNLNKQLQQVISSTNCLKNMIKLQENEQQNISNKIQKDYEKLSSKLTHCSARIDAVYSLQVDFNNGLGILMKSQEILSSEVHNLKNKKQPISDSQVYSTPNNSLVQSSPSQLQQLVISRNYKTQAIKSLHHAPRTRSRATASALLNDSTVQSGIRFNSSIQKKQSSCQLSRLKNQKKTYVNVDRLAVSQPTCPTNTLNNPKNLETGNQHCISLLSDDYVLPEH